MRTLSRQKVVNGRNNPSQKTKSRASSSTFIALHPPSSSSSSSSSSLRASRCSRDLQARARASRATNTEPSTSPQNSSRISTPSAERPLKTTNSLTASRSTTSAPQLPSGGISPVARRACRRRNGSMLSPRSFCSASSLSGGSLFQVPQLDVEINNGRITTIRQINMPLPNDSRIDLTILAVSTASPIPSIPQNVSSGEDETNLNPASSPN
ncbi:hypothetical protein Ahy_A03g016814 [Arachis hypogaea]|uniref:Uncharacterized protein n=1 Tax=Arachis hypogaea TaxID=3818 RepID=A0A445E4E0_ARAHY|nr:hypothetical protein Ahy_A03g016814 [Arachis hypogaea]